MRALLLVDHGSRRPEAGEVLRGMARVLAERVPEGVVVRVAHMELEAPSIAEAIDACVAEGVCDIVLIPYMLAPGRHATEDVPRLAQEAVAQHPGLTLRVTECLGVHPALADVVLARAVL